MKKIKKDFSGLFLGIIFLIMGCGVWYYMTTLSFEETGLIPFLGIIGSALIIVGFSITPVSFKQKKNQEKRFYFLLEGKCILEQSGFEVSIVAPIGRIFGIYQSDGSIEEYQTEEIFGKSEDFVHVNCRKI